MDETYVINLAARYAAAFGVVAVSQIINRQAVVVQEDNRYNVELYGSDDVEFEKVTLTYNNKDLHFGAMLLDAPDSLFAPPIIMNFSREKNLIITEVSGSNSEVVERWGTKPWDIDIRGIVVDVANRKYPTHKIEELCSFFEHNNIVEVCGLQFLEKDIDAIYVESMSITPLEGFADTVQYSLKAKSIQSVNYTLLKPND